MVLSSGMKFYGSINCDEVRFRLAGKARTAAVNASRAKRWPPMKPRFGRNCGARALSRFRVRKQNILFQKRGKVTPADIAIFSRQLATMLGPRAFPLVQAFEIVGNGHDNPAMARLILGIKQDVEGGTALAEALSKQPLYFDDLFVNLVDRR